MRRTLGLITSIGFGLSVILLAGPAHAQTEVTVVPGGASIQVFDTAVRITNVSGIPVVFTTSALSESGQSCAVTCSIFDGASSVFSIAPSADGVSFQIQQFNGGSYVDIQQLTVTYRASGVGPTPVIQQFGLPASGDCEDGVTEAMNWSGIGMDGWGISWAQWVNEGAGGAVCTRTVMYDTSTAKWVVN
jgi:hypothetical protein